MIWLAIILYVSAAAGPRDTLVEARRLYDTREVDRAAALFRDALRQAESQNLAQEQAEALFGLGRIELETDLRTRAKESLDRALTLFERAGDTTGHAQALAESGQARILLGDGTEGIRRIQAAVETLRARSGGTRGRDDVEGLARASAILMAMMPPGPAKDRARDAAFAAARASSFRGHECSIRHAWGADLLRAGEYAGAWRQLTDAVACYEGVPNDRRLTHALLSVGSLKRTHGQFDAALAVFKRAVAISRERRDPVGTVLALNAVASAQTDLWRTDEARASLQSALALARERGMESLAPYTVGQLGAHFTQIGQFADAIPLLEESLAQATTVSRQIERLTQLCAARARGGGDARAALPVCDRNVTLARGDSPTALLYALRARAEARRRSGALDDASADLREAIELVEDLRAKTVPIDFMKRGFSAWHEWLFGSSISVAVQQRDIPRALETAERARARALLDLLATRDINASSTAMLAAATAPGSSVAAARSKPASTANVSGAAGAAAPRASGNATSNAGTSVTVTSDAATSGAASAGAAPVGSGRATSSTAASSAVAGAAGSTAGTATPRAAGPATSSAAPVGTVASDVATSDAAGVNPRGGGTSADGERRTEEDLPRIDSSTAVRAATVPDMIATARRLRSTLLVYWVNPDAVYIWTITPDGALHDARVEVPVAKVIGLVAATRAPASQDAAVGLFALKAPSARRPWRELHDLLIAPVRAHLPKSADALVTIVLQGPLAQLSFAALQDEQGRYLLERHTLHYTPAVGVLAYTAKRQGDAGGGDAPTALLVGDPGELPGGIDGAPLAALPWARREVTEVGAQLARLGSRATVLTDAQASEAAVRAHLSGQLLLHFATHGIVREDETLESFLALRGDRDAATARADGPTKTATKTNVATRTNDAADTNGAVLSAASSTTASSATDGRLTADEVYELKLDADLVVLSACSSALGPTGTEGVIGFTRAFLYAGAASVIATSWNVPDSSSYELMSRFYRVYHARRAAPGAGASANADASAARALRAAQLSTLAALRQGKVTVTTPGGLNGRGTTVALPDHPLFWAGFIVVGEP